MTRILLAAPQPDVRAALRLLLLDLNMEVAGESAPGDEFAALCASQLALISE